MTTIADVDVGALATFKTWLWKVYVKEISADDARNAGLIPDDFNFPQDGKLFVTRGLDGRFLNVSTNIAAAQSVIAEAGFEQVSIH